MDVILVVVDRLTKYADFMGVKHPYFALTVAQTYIDYCKHVLVRVGTVLTLDGVATNQFIGV